MSPSALTCSSSKVHGVSRFPSASSTSSVEPDTSTSRAQSSSSCCSTLFSKLFPLSSKRGSKVNRRSVSFGGVEDASPERSRRPPRRALSLRSSSSTSHRRDSLDIIHERMEAEHAKFQPQVPHPLLVPANLRVEKQMVDLDLKNEQLNEKESEKKLHCPAV